ncbi:uncharacterized protein LOC135959087 [Calliphora vicina]|uniref:uncharacterized protein LOC135959087 n=1 Tax=Calliphora vicina TaxID=7373 RepID=UPI00325A51CE
MYLCPNICRRFIYCCTIYAIVELILKMTLSISCYLCFSSGLTFKCLLDDNGKFNNIYEIAVKYFKPELSKSQEKLSSAVICQKCWDHINEFYNFQQLIRSTQNQIKKCIPIIRIYQREHKLNYVSSPIQSLNLLSTTLDHENSEINTNKVVSPIPVEFRPTDLKQSNNVHISKNSNFSEKESKNIAHRYWISAEKGGFQCDSCHIKFNYTTQLKHHMKIYHNIFLRSSKVYCRCEICKNLTFSCFDNLITHMLRRHHIFSILRKYESSKCKNFKQSYDAARPQLVPLTTTVDQSGHVNPNEDPKLVSVSNNSLIKGPTENHSLPAINVDKATSELIMEDTKIKTSLKQSVHLKNTIINSTDNQSNLSKKSNFQFQTLTTSPQADHAEPNDDDKLEPISNCTIIKATQNQSLPAVNSYIQSEKPFKFKINIDGKFICEMCKNIGFSKFSSLKRHMNEKHEIINPNVNQSIITFNPIANVNKTTSELILEDKIKGIQQIDPSEVDKIQRNRNIILSNNNGTGNGNDGIITKDSYRLKSHIPVTQTHRLEPSDDAEVVANVGDINKNCAMMKPNENQSLEPHKIEIKNNKKLFKCEMNIDGKFKCEMCKYFTFANFFNFKRHMERQHNIGNFINKFNHIKKIQAAKDSDAPHLQLVTLTTSPEQSGHLKPNDNEKFGNGSNNTIINSTANLSINSIANVDTSTSELIMEETILEIDPSEEYNSPMKKTFKCEMCSKYLTFSNFYNLKRHMEKKHHMFNVQNKYKISKKIQATKNSDAPHQQLVTSNTSPEQAGHAKSNEDAILVNGSNNSIINSTDNQSTLSINSIANIDPSTSELIMEDKRKTIQQIHPSEVDKIDFVSPIRDNKNIQLNSNTGQLESVNSTTCSQENENARIVTRDTDRLKSPISVKQANLMKPYEDQSLEPLKINIKIDKNISKPLTTKKIENYRCKKCKHLTFSYFWLLKRHMKMKHQIVNFQNKYKKSKKTADRGKPNQDAELLVNGVTINKKYNYNLRNKNHQMNKVYKKCETQAPDDADLPLQQLNASTKSIQQSDICKLSGDADIVHNVVNINKKCNSAVQNQKKLGIQPTNYLQYDQVENLELNTLNSKDSVAPHLQLVTLTTSSEQSGHVKPNEDDKLVNGCNNTIINATANQSMLSINSIASVDTSTSKLLTEETIQEIDPSEVDSSTNSNIEYSSTMKKTFRCETCKYLTFSNFSNLKRHMEKKHHIFNVRNKYKIIKKIQATKDSDAPHQQMVTSNTSPEQAGHAKSIEDAKLVNGSNNSIINSTENQSILPINPIANVDTSELIMEDKRKTIQHKHPSEVDKIDFVSPIRDNKNIQLNSNTGPLESVNSTTSSLENENARIITRDTDRLKSPISVKQANLMKPYEDQSLEPLKIIIKIDKNISKPLTTKKIENYRCKKCKHLTFSYFWVLKRHMKMKHQIVNFKNKYKKSKKTAASKNYNDQETKFLANGVTINKNCNYNLRNKKHQMDNCVKVYKKCETQATDDADLPLQQLNASTKSLQQSDICKLNGDADVVHNVVNINKKCNSAVQNQKKLGIENLECNTLKKKNAKPKKTFLPDGIDNFIKMSLGDLKCTICERTFGYYSLLSEHFKLKHPNKKCFVNCCGNEVINRRNLVQHLKRHRVAARMSNGEESKMGNNKYSTTSRSYMTNKPSYIIQADPVLAITSVISANPIESINVTSTDQSIPSTSVSSRATTLSKSQFKQCNYCSRTFKYVTSLMKHINKCQFYMRNYCNLNQNTDNRNLCIKTENDFLNTNLNAEDSELNQFPEIKTEIPYDIVVNPNISVPPLDIVDIKEDINFE